MVLTTLPVKTLSPHQVRPNSTCSIELQRGPHNASIVAHVVCACFFLLYCGSWLYKISCQTLCDVFSHKQPHPLALLHPLLVQRFSMHDSTYKVRTVAAAEASADRPDSPLNFSSTGSGVDMEAVGREPLVSLDGRDTVPTVFRWEHGGRKVYITGTFNNWKDSDEKWEMHRSRNDFQFITDLPRGQHMYKFIVDGEWRFAPDQETLADEQGTIQNVVDLSNFRRDLMEQENVFDYDGQYDDESLYGQHIPALHEYTKEPALLPPHMRHIILNQHLQDKPPRAMPIPQHVTLNHLYCTAMKGGLVVLSTTQRYREKFVTTVSYMVQDEEFSRIMVQIGQVKAKTQQAKQLQAQQQQQQFSGGNNSGGSNGQQGMLSRSVQ